MKAAVKGGDWPILKPRIVEYLLALINVKLEMVLNQSNCKKSLIAKDKTLKMKNIYNQGQNPSDVMQAAM